jgi:hypothetical protein
MSTALADRLPTSAGLATTRRQDLVTAGLATWLLIGLFVDGWAHTNLDRTLETFFTPWHALFYSGFTATAGWMAWLVGARRRPAEPLLAAIPPGYGAGVVGVGVFAIGGVGDWLWHTFLGIEVSLDALLSPTHLLLFAGTVLIVSAPYRAVTARHPGRAITAGELRPALLAAFLVTLVTAFFFMYAWAPTSGTMGMPFIPGQDEMFGAFGVLEAIVTTLILMGGAVWLLVRWDLPAGSFTTLFGGVGLMMTGLEAFDPWWGWVAPLVAGVAFDLMAAGTRSVGRLRLAGGVVPLVLSGTAALLFQIAGPGTPWPPEVWGGMILFSGLAGAGLTTLALANVRR